MKNKTGRLLLSVLAGATVGALTALVFAPKSGKDLRKDIKGETDKALDTAEDYVGIVKEKGSEALDTAQDAGSDMMQTRKKALHKMGTQVGRAVDRVEDDQTETAKYNLKQAADTHAQARDRAKNDAKQAASKVMDTVSEAAEEIKNQ